MKVGIITIYDNLNIGNRLQNYALQKILQKYADEVVSIRNKPRPKTLKDKMIRSSFFSESVFANAVLGKKRKVQFLKFNKAYLNNSKSCTLFDRNSYDENIEKCDYYCAGSDQIWNPNIGRVGLFNYLDFSPIDRNFSYSASFGIDKIPDKFKNDVANGLKNIKHISVREVVGKKIVEDLTGRTDAEVLIDPTLYFDADEWAKIAQNPKFLTDDKYVLTYFLGGASEKRRAEIEHIAQNNGFKIIDILDKKTGYYDKVGPSEFVYLIKNAKLVCTDSFHASVFSFIFDRPLEIFPREGKGINMNSRLETLTSKFELEKCLINNEHIDENIFEVDYTEGHRKLIDERNKVDRFLNKVFSKEN